MANLSTQATVNKVIPRVDSQGKRTIQLTFTIPFSLANMEKIVERLGSTVMLKTEIQQLTLDEAAKQAQENGAKPKRTRKKAVAK